MKLNQKYLSHKRKTMKESTKEKLQQTLRLKDAFKAKILQGLDKDTPNWIQELDSSKKASVTDYLNKYARAEGHKLTNKLKEYFYNKYQFDERQTEEIYNFYTSERNWYTEKDVKWC
eukprot:UN02991